MKINDVEKITGLTAKAIRLYESRGLISVTRKENGYRSYTEGDVEVLKKIKLFRSVGIGISDIKLYLFGVISIEDLIEKRKAEILQESGKNSEKYQLCEGFLSGGLLSGGLLSGSLSGDGPLSDGAEGDDFIESERTSDACVGVISVGIDIGTTTISAVVYDLDNRCPVEVFSIPHASYVKTGVFSEQSVDAIIEKAKRLLFHVLGSYENVASIGITGQMHGIVYIDSRGKAVSNLINWQDKRGDVRLDCGKTICQLIYEKTGEVISTGYGIATHYYNCLMDIVPSGAISFCTIMDLFAIEICQLEKPLLHASNCASLGLFDVKNNCFKADKLSLLGIDGSILPSVTDKSVIIGKCKGISVSVPIGDNQASFLGSVKKNQDSMLVNIGTGSQISCVSDKYIEVDRDLELRPFIEGKYLICGSALCGGFAYSMLEEFFRSYTISTGMQEKSQYETMNKLATDAYEKGESGLLVESYFCGKRSDPDLRGSINMIDRYSFTPSNLILGVLKGMCNELYDLYERVPNKKSHIVASGGAIKKTEVLKVLIAKCFGASVSTSKMGEEASLGAGLFSALATNKINYNDGFCEHIREE